MIRVLDRAKPDAENSKKTVHNQARSEVGVGPLSWNQTLAAYAQNYADQRSGDCEMEHSGGPYGENLAEGYGNMDGSDAKFRLPRTRSLRHRGKVMKEMAKLIP